MDLSINDIEEIDNINIDKDTNTFSSDFVIKIKEYIIYLEKEIHLLYEDNDLLREDRDKAERKVGILKRRIKKKNSIILKTKSKLSKLN